MGLTVPVLSAKLFGVHVSVIVSCSYVKRSLDKIFTLSACSTGSSVKVNIKIMIIDTAAYVSKMKLYV